MDDVIDLSTLGVEVVERREWPRYAIIPSGVTEGRINRARRLTTTQRYVYRDIVEQKQAEIRRGEIPRVEVAPTHNRWWVLDGHHTLAAYLL